MTESKNNLKIEWNGGVDGNGLLTAEKFSTNVAIPKAIGGSGDGTDPKELLVSSASSCFTLTLTSLLRNRHLPLEDYVVHTEATTVGKDISIVHEASLVLAADATEEQIKSAEKAIEGADTACTIGNLLKKAGLSIEYKANVTKQ